MTMSDFLGIKTQNQMDETTDFKALDDKQPVWLVSSYLEFITF